MKASILIPTIVERKNKFIHLWSTLSLQIKEAGLQDEIEIVSLSDNREMKIGEKRNKLLDMAKGEYIFYIDDDDLIDNQYINRIYKGIQSNPDCIGIKGIITFNGINPKEFIHSLQHKTYSENATTYFRPPNHLNPIKSSIAKQFKFPEINHGEDTDWCMQIQASKLLQTEYMIEEPIYYYNYLTTPH
jgi:glycosyltransferase involved in cell wall biosynthesis